MIQNNYLIKTIFLDRHIQILPIYGNMVFMQNLEAVGVQQEKQLEEF